MSKIYSETTQAKKLASDDPGTYTEAEAIQRMSWRDMGTEKGTKTFYLEFFCEDGNPETGRGAMKHAYIEQSVGAGGDKKYRVYSRGGEYLGTAHATLKPAKAEGIKSSLGSIRTDGYIKDVGEPVSGEVPTTEESSAVAKTPNTGTYTLAETIGRKA